MLNSTVKSVVHDVSEFALGVKVKRRYIAILDTFRQGQLSRKLFQRVSSLDLLKLDSHVLVQELVDCEVSSTDADLKLSLHYANLDPFGTILVLACRFTHEHKLEFVAIREVVDEVSQFAIDGILHDWDVHSDLLLQVDTVDFKSVYFLSLILDLVQKGQTDLVCFEDAGFKLGHVLNRLHHLLLVLHSQAF